LRLSSLSTNFIFNLTIVKGIWALPWQGCQQNQEEIPTTLKLTTTKSSTTISTSTNESIKAIYYKYIKDKNKSLKNDNVFEKILPIQTNFKENNATKGNGPDLNYIGPQEGENHGKRGKKNFSLLFQEELRSNFENETEDIDEIQERYAYIIVPVKVSKASGTHTKKLKPKLPHKQPKYPMAAKDKQKNYQGK
jgi:hypothetical protein